MTIAAGTKIGPYDVVAPIGAGGMGEVYRARDTKLDRDVALKVLPDHLIDQDRLARFTREAQVVASLSHPNIGAIHGLEQLDGRPVLVLELVEGPTLADRLAQGPLPQDEAVSIARQIAEALEAAHEQGVVHRDLKPANVKLRPDGLVKVLDFGLAKLAGPPDANPAKAGLHGDGGVRLQPDMTMSPTITSPAMTGLGLILGTAAYMSPEQAAGKPADKRADIWSFGVTLWEMLTGQRLFGDGESTSHVLADVLRAPIDFEKTPAGPLRELLRRCLDRNVKTRLRDIGEARVILSRPIEPGVVVRDVAAPRRSVVVPWALAALLAIATGIGLWAPWRREPVKAPVRLDVSLGEEVALAPGTLGRTLNLSPDGTRLMYVASVNGGPDRLYIRRLEDERDKIVELPGSDGVAAAAFSPDSRAVAFVAGTRVYRASVDGGTPLRLAEVPVPSNQVTWGEGDVILVSGIRSGLMRIPASSGPDAGGKRIPLVTAAGAYFDPRVSPDGTRVLLTALRGTGPDIVVHDAKSDSAPRQLTFDAVSVDPVWIGREGRYFAFLKLAVTGGTSRVTAGGLQWARTGGGDSQTLLSDVRIVDLGAFNQETNRLTYVALEGTPNKGPSVRNIYTVSITEESGSAQGRHARAIFSAAVWRNLAGVLS